MPKPKKKEGKQDFLKRCTNDLTTEGKPAKEAYAACNGIWDQERKQRSALSLTLSPEIKAAEKGTKRAFYITAYTGKKLATWGGDLIIDIAGIQTKEKLPILREHARDRVVGFGAAWSKEHFYISGKFSENTPDGREVLALADEGYPWQASISVRALKVEELKDEKTRAKVNGQEVTGPLEIWRESKVGEVSFVSLGADDDTAAITMSDDKFDVELSISEPDETAGTKEEEETMPITLKELKEKHPELYTEVFDMGAKSIDLEKVKAETMTDAMAQGAEQERARIQSVRGQSIPGHEALIETLMFDGKTTGPEAAVLVLKAEKTARAKVLKDHSDDAPDPLAQPATDEAQGTKAKADDDLPLEEQCKAKWDREPAIRKEFDGDYAAFLAGEKAMAAGQVRIISSKENDR